MTDDEKLKKITTITEYTMLTLPVYELLSIATSLMMADLWRSDDAAIDKAYKDITGSAGVPDDAVRH